MLVERCVRVGPRPGSAHWRRGWCPPSPV